MVASGGPSTGQTCGLVLIFAVLLQSICVAITFLYFTNELQQINRQMKTEEQMESHLAVELKLYQQVNMKASASFKSWANFHYPLFSRFSLRDTYAKSSFACFTREHFFLEDMDPNDKEDGDPCWEVKWQLSRLIRKMVAKNRAEEATSALTQDNISPDAIARDVPRNPRVAAHLTSSRNARKGLFVQSSPIRNNLGFKIISWQSSVYPSFLHNVLLNNGELIIQQPGFYYIYAQTYFRFRESEGVESNADPDSDSIRNPKQMVQYISKFTDYYPEAILLMKSARTSCWSRNQEYGLYSIYQGGVFQLRRNDRIFVSISYKELVDMDKEASFFGAFLVS